MLRLTAVLWCLASLILTTGCASDEVSFEDRATRQVIFTVAGPDPAVTVASGYAADYKENSATGQESTIREIGRILQFHRLKKISQWSMKALGLEAIVAEIRGNRSVDQVLRSLSADERVETVQTLTTYNLLTYNDPYFHLQNPAVKDADIERIHHIATGKDVVVGVVDTGVDRQHPELAGQIIFSRNFVAQDSRRFDSDEHGTSVAGVIASAANNDLGIVGVAPDVKLMVFKACWQEPLSGRAKCDNISIIKALDEVLKQHPDILNLSLAGPPDPLIKRLLAAASERGMIIIAAVDADRVNSFPASMEEVIAVSTPLQMAEAMPPHGLLAPGTDVLTTTPGATYAFYSGSSMATAYVSGVAALLKERQPTLSSEQFRAQMTASARYNVNQVPVVDICQAVVGMGSDACAIGSMAQVIELESCETCSDSM